MTADEDARSDSRWSADVTARALRAADQVRDLRGRLAETALAVAATLDQVAATREARATQVVWEPAARLRAAARRARAMAEDERTESRELRTARRDPG